MLFKVAQSSGSRKVPTVDHASKLAFGIWAEAEHVSERVVNSANVLFIMGLLWRQDAAVDVPVLDRLRRWCLGRMKGAFGPTNGDVTNSCLQTFNLYYKYE